MKVDVDKIKELYGEESWRNATMLAPGQSMFINMGRTVIQITRWYPCWDYIIKTVT